MWKYFCIHRSDKIDWLWSGGAVPPHPPPPAPPKLRLCLQIIKTQNSVSQKIWILHKINKKKDILNRNISLQKSMLISMNSILGWASFCMNYCINAVWHGGDQPVALLRCNGRSGCFNSGLQVICIVGSGVSHLPLDNTWQFSMGFRSGEFDGQSSTVTPW